MQFNMNSIATDGNNSINYSWRDRSRKV